MNPQHEDRQLTLRKQTDPISFNYTVDSAVQLRRQRKEIGESECAAHGYCASDNSRAVWNDQIQYVKYMQGYSPFVSITALIVMTFPIVEGGV